MYLSNLLFKMKKICQILITKKNKHFIQIVNKWKLLELLFLKYIKFGKWFYISIDFLFLFEKLQHEIYYFSIVKKFKYKVIKLIEFYFMKLLLRYFTINNSVFLEKWIKTIKITIFKNTKKKLIILNLTRQTKIYLLFQIFNNYIIFKKIKSNNTFLCFNKMLLFQFEFLIDAYFEIMYFHIYSFQQNKNPLQSIGFLKTKKIYFCYYYINL